MKLKELLNVVKEHKKGILTEKQLREKDEAIVVRSALISEECMCSAKGQILGLVRNKANIVVYESGYVLYEETESNIWYNMNSDGNRKKTKPEIVKERRTVFHLDDIREQCVIYDTVNPDDSNRENRCVPYEKYEGENWNLRLQQEGIKRLQQNEEKTYQKYNEFHYSPIAEDIPALGYLPNYLEEQEIMIDKQRSSEIIEIIRDELKPKQWEVFYRIVAEGKRQQTVAEELGISQQVVSLRLKAAMGKIEELRHDLKKYYYDE